MTWEVTGAGCTGYDCGYVDAPNANTVIYYPPNSLPDPATVTLTATAVANREASAAATITLDARVIVSVYPENLTIALGDTRQFGADLINDFGGGGVTWTVTGCPDGVPCGTFSPETTPAGVPTQYTAPPTVPNDIQATVVATSVADPSQSGTAALTISTTAKPITVSLSSTAVEVPIAGTLDVTATVLHDPHHQGAGFTVAGCTSPPCGFFARAIDDPPEPGTWVATYVAPSTPQTTMVGNEVTITATSNEDPGKSASMTLTLTGSPVNFSTQDAPAGHQPTGVALADFNGDGILDIAVADYGDPDASDDGDVDILLGHGDGTFQAPTAFAAGKNPINIVATDLNRDGRQDIVVDDFGERPAGGPGDVNVLLGNGDGSFGAPAHFAAGNLPFSLLTADFNNDLNPDIAVSDAGDQSVGNDGGVNLLAGNGDGLLNPAVLQPAGKTPAWITAQDFNSDGRVDLAVADYQDPASTSHGGMTVLAGNGDGTFGSSAFYSFTGYPTSIAAGDLDGNGTADLFACSFAGGFGVAGGSQIVALNNGDGSFAPPTSVETEGGQVSEGSIFPLSAVMADFDGDSKLDVAEIFGHTVSVLHGNGDGSFQGRRVSGFRTRWFQGRLIFTDEPDPFSLAIGDLNADGKPDIVVANLSSDDVSVLLNTSGN